MPLINDRFYMNPAYGRAVEAARAAEHTLEHGGSDAQDEGASGSPSTIGMFISTTARWSGSLLIV
jgi:hypothetical protein